jgi:hypothetical protein
MNKTTPKDIPFCTLSVCSPKYVASDIISLNHKVIPQANKITEVVNKILPIG